MQAASSIKHHQAFAVHLLASKRMCMYMQPICLCLYVIGLLDAVFCGLGLSSSGWVDHPILMSEPICNPNWSRAQLQELLFECYQVPLAG